MRLYEVMLYMFQGLTVFPDGSFETFQGSRATWGLDSSFVDAGRLATVPAGKELVLLTHGITECLGVGFHVRHNGAVIAYGMYHSASEHSCASEFKSTGFPAFIRSILAILQANPEFTVVIYTHSGSAPKRGDLKPGGLFDAMLKKRLPVEQGRVSRLELVKVGQDFSGTFIMGRHFASAPRSYHLWQDKLRLTTYVQARLVFFNSRNGGKLTGLRKLVFEAAAAYLAQISRDASCAKGLLSVRAMLLGLEADFSIPVEKMVYCFLRSGGRDLGSQRLAQLIKRGLSAGELHDFYRKGRALQASRRGLFGGSQAKKTEKVSASCVKRSSRQLL